jgi:PadR family transcriptional regulator PadR
VATKQRITEQTERILDAVMSNPTAEWSGADIARKTGIASGTLYPALLRMERIGWLSWRWEEIDPSEEGRPRKRLYTITGSGEAASREIEHDAELRRRLRARRKGFAGASRGLTA